MIQLASYKSIVDNTLQKLQYAESQLQREQSALAVAEEKLETQQQAQQIIQEISQALQQRVHNRISGVVSRCLHAVFVEEPYEFRIEFDRKRGRTEARLVFERDGVVLDDPLNEVGGGVIDVAALALRLSCILLSRPPVRKLLVLDEPFANIRGDAYRSRTREMLLKLSEELGIQIIINTDIPAYALGTVIDFA